MADQVPENDRRARYTVTNPAGQSEFIIDYDLDNVDEVVAYKNGVVIDSEDYTVDLSDGTLTLDSAADQGDIITIDGLITLKRENGYPLRGDLKSQLVNYDMNRVIKGLQEMRRDLDGTVRLNAGESISASSELPVFVASKVLRVNAAGNAIELVDAGDISADIAASVAAAETAETGAETALASAQAVLAQTQAIYDNFDDRYLGQKSSDPALDNDGEAVLDGALYYNTTNNAMYVYDLDTTTWLKIETNVADGSIGTSKLADGAVQNSKLSDMAEATIKGRASGAGTGVPADLTAAQVRDAVGVYSEAEVDALVAGVSGITEGTKVSASGTAIDFTSIPSGTKRIVVQFLEVSLDGSDTMVVQVGDSGGIETSGYVGASSFVIGGGGNGTSYTAGFGIRNGTGTGYFTTGTLVLTRSDASNNTWVASGSFGVTGAVTGVIVSGGVKTLSGELDRLRITPVGSNSFDAGDFNITYE